MPLLLFLLVTVTARQISADDLSSQSTTPLSNLRTSLQRYCLDCHNNDEAEARINVQSMTDDIDFESNFRDWEKVVRMLRDGRMPPEDMPQPADSERSRLIQSVEAGIRSYIDHHAGDPGDVVIRRLTSAEYGYTIHDLTGLDLDLEQGFISDAVGGEGFTNVGGAQFMQDSTLERYLESAKLVAAHAVIGAGPLMFYRDPGETGRELAAINRIKSIYRLHGFRTAAGEGAEPFGLEKYPQVFYVCWQFEHRDTLGLADRSLAELAEAQGVYPGFAEHVYGALTTPQPLFPMSVITSEWKALPQPKSATDVQSEIRSACDQLYRELRLWQSTLAASAGDEEEAAVLTAGEIHARPTHKFFAKIDWPIGAETAVIELSVQPATEEDVDGAFVVWHKPHLLFRNEGVVFEKQVPLTDVLDSESLAKLHFGEHPTGAKIADDSFVFQGATDVHLTMIVPDGATDARLQVDVALDLEQGADRVVRCTVDDGAVEGETAAETGASSALLANPDGPMIESWKAGVDQFARNFPEVSQREPAPSDRDPIPPPYDNSYNVPERNHWHYAVKYHRDDDFLVQHMLDDDVRGELDRAWTDLLTSFDYHNVNFEFVRKKFGLDIGEKDITNLDQPTIDQLPDEPRRYAQRWRDEYVAMYATLREAEIGHLNDALRFADRAWRRPLSTGEQNRLREFYWDLRNTEESASHPAAIRALISRILVAPAFLYRAEKPQLETTGAETVPLTDWELANRLSYFLWSSVPDKPLIQAAEEGRLQDPAELSRQARRMLGDEKARRFTAEFFGQWLGFYRFDEYQGIDAGRFPQFGDRLKSSMYDEAVSFFEYIVRNNRAVDDILFADYAFLNQALADHYGIAADGLSQKKVALYEGVSQYRRGGLLGLGAILTATSAPLRTSAVKRGDWVLRRIVGTPVPPPPADAGSIPADDVLADGLTVRQRLERHRTDAACVNCHSRIDPLGFALEHYDTIGRWRDTYRDGQKIDPGGVLLDGTEISGPDGLKSYLRREQASFHHTLCAKLTGYALGRAELLSDRPLIEQMMADADEGHGIADLVVRIVTSRQFRHHRIE